MTKFFTSDSHFRHARILELGEGRPFKSIQHHDEMLIKYWNDVVSPKDTVYHLGDVALGPWPEGLNHFKRLNGTKILVPGNHDRIFSGEKAARRERFMPDYEEAFDNILPEITEVRILGTRFMISHFPYREEIIGGKPDRYLDKRPADEGVPLIHGHTHQSSVITHSEDGTVQISVGVDAWNWTPVSETQVMQALLSDSE